jgi:hypothetical protein
MSRVMSSLLETHCCREEGQATTSQINIGKLASLSRRKQRPLETLFNGGSTLDDSFTSCNPYFATLAAALAAFTSALRLFWLEVGELTVKKSSSSSTAQSSIPCSSFPSASDVVVHEGALLRDWEIGRVVVEETLFVVGNG